MTLFEQLQARGLHAGTLPLDLACSIPYCYVTDLKIGTEIITFKEVKVEVN